MGFFSAYPLPKPCESKVILKDRTSDTLTFKDSWLSTLLTFTPKVCLLHHDNLDSKQTIVANYTVSGKKYINNVQISSHILMKKTILCLSMTEYFGALQENSPKPPIYPVINFTLSEDALMECYKNSNLHLTKSWQLLETAGIYQVLCSTSNIIFRNLPMLNFSIFL